jgi:multisubunit Na+/H+ antiporter MnhB subunit
MWFQFLSLLIATALIGKASIALATRQKFYAVRSRQYTSESLPWKLLAGPIIVGALTLVAWYATIFHYRPAGWVVTGFLTALSCMAFDHVFRWKRHRQVMLKLVANPNVWLIDCVLLAIGAGFVALALLVY